MIIDHNYAAVDALKNTGHIEITYNREGQALFSGQFVSVSRIHELAKNMGVVITAQRHVIDNGFTSLKLSK